VAYSLKDRTRDPEGYVLTTDTDANGNFLITLYRLAGLVTSPYTATVRLYGTTASPKRVGLGLQRATSRWQGTTVAIVTYVRVGGAFVTGTSRVVLNHRVPAAGIRAYAGSACI
jgi:hypothetical protein